MRTRRHRRRTREMAVYVGEVGAGQLALAPFGRVDVREDVAQDLPQHAPRHGGGGASFASRGPERHVVEAIERRMSRKKPAELMMERLERLRPRGAPPLQVVSSSATISPDLRRQIAEGEISEILVEGVRPYMREMFNLLDLQVRRLPHRCTVSSPR